MARPNKALNHGALTMNEPLLSLYDKVMQLRKYMHNFLTYTPFIGMGEYQTLAPPALGSEFCCLPELVPLTTAA